MRYAAGAGAHKLSRRAPEYDQSTALVRAYLLVGLGAFL